MKKKKVISYSNLPSRIPVQFTVIVYLIFREQNIPDWLSGVVYTVLVFIWISYFLQINYEESIDILGDDEVKK